MRTNFPFLLLAAAAFCGLLPSSATADIKSEAIEYSDGETTLQGHVAFDPNIAGKRPGILVIHDWMGVAPYSIGRAEQLAKLGYIAFVADIYGKGVRPKDPAEASALAGKYKSDRALLRRRANAGLQKLAQHPQVDSSKIAAIGYCFGGTSVLELARSGADLRGVVSFHGGLATPSPGDAKNIRCKVLALHGADDPAVPRKEVEGFEDEMRSAGV